jgi:hypothetical protein
MQTPEEALIKPLAVIAPLVQPRYEKRRCGLREELATLVPCGGMTSRGRRSLAGNFIEQALNECPELSIGGRPNRTSNFGHPC